MTSCARPTTMRPVLRAVQQPAEGVSDTYRSFSNYGHTPESSKEELLLRRRVRAYRYGGFQLVALATISVGPRNSTVVQSVHRDSRSETSRCYRPAVVCVLASHGPPLGIRSLTIEVFGSAEISASPRPKSGKPVAMDSEEDRREGHWRRPCLQWGRSIET